MQKIHKDKINWQEVADRFHSRLRTEILNINEPSFFLFLFGHYTPTEQELIELQGYERGLKVAKELFMRSIYEMIDENETVLTKEYLDAEQEDFDNTYIEEQDLFPTDQLWEEGDDNDSEH